MAALRVPEGFADPVNDDGFGNEIFDPFALGADAFPSMNTPVVDEASSASSPHPPPTVNRLTRSTDDRRPVNIREERPSSPEDQKIVAIPPKLLVKFNIHEEVNSVANVGVENEGSSEVNVEGKLYCQIQSSDALKNSPFALVATTLQGGRVQFRPNDDFVKEPSSALQSIPAHSVHIVNIPKLEIGSVHLGSYVFAENVRHMPVLVERKGKARLVG